MSEAAVKKVEESIEDQLDDKKGVPGDLLKLHPLKSPWQLYYLKCDRSIDWERALKTVAEFNSVEGFWTLFSRLRLPSAVDHNLDYSVFKKGIKPMWEDDSNKPGGRWLLSIDRNSKTLCDRYWLELLMAIVGGQFEELDEHICGAVFNFRAKGYKISLWIRNADSGNKSDILRIGELMKEKCGTAEELRFEVHAETSYKNHNRIPPRYVL